jgi:hypothetical protein
MNRRIRSGLDHFKPLGAAHQLGMLGSTLPPIVRPGEVLSSKIFTTFPKFSQLLFVDCRPYCFVNR